MHIYQIRITPAGQGEVFAGWCFDITELSRAIHSPPDSPVSSRMLALALAATGVSVTSELPRGVAGKTMPGTTRRSSVICGVGATIRDYCTFIARIVHSEKDAIARFDRGTLGTVEVFCRRVDGRDLVLSIDEDVLATASDNVLDDVDLRFGVSVAQQYVMLANAYCELVLDAMGTASGLMAANPSFNFHAPFEVTLNGTGVSILDRRESGGRF